MTHEDTASVVIESIGLVNARDVCDCHDAGVLPVDLEMSPARLHARLEDGFVILGWITDGGDNE